MVFNRSHSREHISERVDTYDDDNEKISHIPLSKEIVNWFYSKSSKWVHSNDPDSLSMQKVDIYRVSSSKCTVTISYRNNSKNIVERVDNIYEELTGCVLEWIVEKQSGLIWCENTGKEYSVKKKEIISADTPGLRPHSEVKFFVH